MTKREALHILIEDSLLLSDDIKNQLMAKLPVMDEAMVDELGTFLCLEQRKRDEGEDRLLQQLPRILEEMEKSDQQKNAE